MDEYRYIEGRGFLFKEKSKKAKSKGPEVQPNLLLNASGTRRKCSLHPSSGLFVSRFILFKEVVLGEQGLRA